MICNWTEMNVGVFSVLIVNVCFNSPTYAAGQQCCYDSTGAQVLTADSIGGSTPDRGHDWGSPPFKKPPRIPGQSHWVYDVISFYYCCLWSDNCYYYFKHRPSSDCRRYQSPGSGEWTTVLRFMFSSWLLWVLSLNLLCIASCGVWRSPLHNIWWCQLLLQRQRGVHFGDLRTETADNPRPNRACERWEQLCVSQ